MLSFSSLPKTDEQENLSGGQIKEKKKSIERGKLGKIATLHNSVCGFRKEENFCVDLLWITVVSWEASAGVFAIRRFHNIGNSANIT